MTAPRFATLLDAARWYIKREHSPIAVPYGSKNPNRPDWEKERVDASNVARHFNGQPSNIGVLDGFNDHTDADLDTREAILIAPDYLPNTGILFGRKSKPRSHWFYRSPGLRTKEFRNPLTHKMVLEFRGLDKDGGIGLQTVVPPSLHGESGETIEFAEAGAPAEVAPEVLFSAGSKIASAALLARYWPAHGRHVAMLALAGVLARAGWPIDEAKKFCHALYGAVDSHDPKQVNRSNSEVESTYTKFAADQEITGFPTLTGLIDRKVLSAALGWLAIEPPDWHTGLMVAVLASGKTRIEANHANAIYALSHAPEWAGVLGYDEFADRIVSRSSPPWGAEPGIWRDVDDTIALEWLQRAGIALRSSKTVYEAVQVVAYRNTFNSLQDYLNGIVYDGQCRLERWLITYLGAEDTPYNRAIGPRILIAAAARAFVPGCKSDCMAVLESDQGELKSSTCSTLAIHPEWFTDHITGDLGSKSSREDIRGKWIVEQSEMDKIKGKELEPIKNFLSTQIDHYRESYGRRSGPHPRTCLFIGTTNARFYLADPTGARRFWPVRCGHIDLDALKHDVTQLWGEAVSLYHQHQPWHLDTPELVALARAEQEQRYVAGMWDSLIEHYIAPFDARGNPVAELKRRRSDDWESEYWFGSTPFKVNTDDVLIHCIGKDPKGYSPRDANEVAKYFNHLRWERKQEGARPHRGKWYFLRPGPATPPPPQLLVRKP